MPKSVQVQDATVNNAGYFLQLQQARFPEKKIEWLKPILVLHGGGKDNDFEPRQGGKIVRFVTAKKLGLN